MASTLRVAIDAARDLIALTPTFQAARDAVGDPKTALESVYKFSAESALVDGVKIADLRPLAVVGQDPDTDWRPIYPNCRQVSLLSKIGVFVTLTMNHDPDLSVGDMHDKFADHVGGIVDDLGGAGDQVAMFGTDDDKYGFDSVVMEAEIAREKRVQGGTDDFWIADLVLLRERR